MLVAARSLRRPIRRTASSRRCPTRGDVQGVGRHYSEPGSFRSQPRPMVDPHHYGTLQGLHGWGSVATGARASASRRVSGPSSCSRTGRPPTAAPCVGPSARGPSAQLCGDDDHLGDREERHAPRRTPERRASRAPRAARRSRTARPRGGRSVTPRPCPFDTVAGRPTSRLPVGFDDARYQHRNAARSPSEPPCLNLVIHRKRSRGVTTSGRLMARVSGPALPDPVVLP